MEDETMPKRSIVKRLVTQPIIIDRLLRRCGMENKEEGEVDESETRKSRDIVIKEFLRSKMGLLRKITK